MRNEVIETLELGDFKAEIHQDENPMSPKDWDQVGVLVTWHRRYTFEVDGRKEFGDPADFLAQAKKERWVYLPVAMIDSGISLYEGSGAHMMDPGGWNSGQVGFIYTTRERFRKMADTKLHRWRIRAAELLRSELKTWDQYVTGDVYGYIIRDPEGENVDSCWGFYGFEYAKEEAMSILKYHREQADQAEKMEKETFAL